MFQWLQIRLAKFPCREIDVSENDLLLRINYIKKQITTESRNRKNVFRKKPMRQGHC